uniref:INTS5_C domain-containing protein n=1 Tax=Gongylonema pulchrum TaxID=637853 RepID=A0A183D633_9BILA
LFCSTVFSEAVVNYLCSTGVEQLRQYLIVAQNNKATLEYHENCKQKLLIISDLLAFLATQNNGYLRKAIRDMIIEDREILRNTAPTFEQLHDLSLPFLIRMVTNSPDLLRFVVHNAHDLATTDLIVNGAKFISQLNKQCLLPKLSNTAYSYAAFMRQLVFYLNSEGLALVMEVALPVALNDHLIESFPGYKTAFCNKLRNGACSILEKEKSTFFVEYLENYDESYVDCYLERDFWSDSNRCSFTENVPRN